MRHLETLDYAGLRAEAEKAVGRRTLEEVSADVGKAVSSVSRALTKTGGRYAKLQRKIIATYTDYAVDEEPLFTVRRKGK